jgi:Zn-dependent protease with chaperone function
MRLTRGMAPKVFNSIDRRIDKLGLTSRIDIYCSQKPAMNAFCYPPHEGAIYILLTSALLEKLNEDELTFVIGHFLCQHHLLSGLASGLVASQLTPAKNIRLHSWQRNGELTADRIGLICCGSYETACTANFKLSSGVTSRTP